MTVTGFDQISHTLSNIHGLYGCSCNRLTSYPYIVRTWVSCQAVSSTNSLANTVWFTWVEGHTLQLSKPFSHPNTGADPDIEERGGIHRVGLVRSSLHAHHNAKGLGACSPRKISEFRPYESASEAIGDHHNHAKSVASGL